MKNLIAVQSEHGPKGSVLGVGGGRARVLFVFALVGSLVQPMVDAAEQKAMVSFHNPGDADNWVSVNDDVMGGVSTGGFEITEDNTLRFSGILSMENNGGFSSIRTRPREMNLGGLTGVEVKLRGDGRAYSMDLRIAGQPGASSYRASFPAPEGAWVTAFLPLSDFNFQSYGREVDAPTLDPASIRSIGFMLADKQEGPFQLEIASVRAVFTDGQAGGGNSLIDVASGAGDFQTLLAAATAADLVGALSSAGPFTLFAPTDAAFAELPAGTLDDLLKPENKSRLIGILKYHVVSGRVNLAQALAAKQAPTLQGETISASFEDGRVKIGPATLIQADIPAANGIIHVIDQVLLPPEKAPAPPLSPTSLIELAIRRGVPLFNHGQHGACAAIYEVTCQALRSMPGLEETDRNDLEQALNEIEREQSPRRQAWILRHSLDRVYARLQQ